MWAVRAWRIIDERNEMWENPIMESVTKLDARRRGIFPLPFQPGDILVKETHDAESVTFRLVKPANVPVVNAVEVDGRWMLPPGGSRELIASAIRADRDGR